MAGRRMTLILAPDRAKIDRVKAAQKKQEAEQAPPPAQDTAEEQAS